MKLITIDIFLTFLFSCSTNDASEETPDESNLPLGIDLTILKKPNARAMS